MDVTESLKRAASIKDLAELARQRVSRTVFDYVEGAAGSESSYRRTRVAFEERVGFVPSVLGDVSSVDTSVKIQGRHATIPLILSSTSYTKMLHDEGESAIARAASRAGLPYALATLGTTTPEEFVNAAPEGDNWFQLYLAKDEQENNSLLRRVEEAGFRVLFLTVDSQVPGNRLRDVRNDLVITTRPALYPDGGTTIKELMSRFKVGITPSDFAWVREHWSGPLIVKGVQHPHDAKKFAEYGADGIVISNHGGRQLDRAIPPLTLLPEVVEAVRQHGKHIEVYVDSGVQDGGDIAAAVALGADACMIGRAYLYGLMAAGEAGVQRVLDIFIDDFRRTMQLLGITKVSDLGSTNVVIARATHHEVSLGGVNVRHAQARKLSAQARYLGLRRSMSLRVACFPMHVRSVLARAAVAFEIANPDTTVEITVVDPDDDDSPRSLLSLLHGGKADMVLGPYSAPSIETIKLWRVRIIVAMAGTHPLRREDSVSLDSIMNERIFTLGRSIRSHQQFEQLCLDFGVEANIAGSTSAEALIALAENGYCCAVMGDDNLPEFPDDPFPWLRSLNGTPFETDMNLCWMPNELSLASRNFVEFITQNREKHVRLASRMN